MKSKFTRFSKISVLAAILWVGVTVVSGTQIEDKTVKSFPVQPGGQLLVQVDRGTIEITPAEVEAVKIEIIRKVSGSESQATQALKDHLITTAQKGNTVEVRAEYKGSQSSGWFGGQPQFKVSYQITVPRQFNVNLKTAGGSITVGELAGKTEAYTSGGSLKFEQTEGAITGRTSGGSITVQRSRGPVDIATSGGSLNLSEIEGDVVGKTSGGSIRVTKLTGKSRVETSGGSIEVAGIKGSIEAGTSGGNITARLMEQPSGDCSFKTSGGSVTVVLGKKIAVDVDARTSAGRVSTDFPVVSVIQGEQKKNELRGKINGGGPLITAHTSGGSVRFEKN